MEIQEIKIDGVVYVPTESLSCEDCFFCNKCEQLSFKGAFINKSLCDLVNGHALEVKED